jgi:pimeloyl-ACP methyl ester carboxylesterase
MRTQKLVVALTVIIGACASGQQSDAVDFSSDRITIATQGAGADIILVPGVGAHSDTWAAIADSLDEQFRLHIVQVNGCAGPLTPDQFDAGMRESYANARNARLVRVDSSNHYIHFDQPGRVVAEIRTFMTSTR